MASPDEILQALSLEESQSSNNIAHQVSVYKYRKKQAANDAQLLMNRIALLQKEEERARKKIEMTKDRADEIIAMRNEHGKRIESSVKSAQEEQNLQAELQRRNKEMEKQGIKNREQLRNQILTKRREDAMKVQHDKKELTKQLLKEQEKELRLKQLKKEKIRKMEEEAKAKRDAEIKAKEEEIKRYYREKALKEAEEAKKAEKLVKALEKKEREWMEKLQQAQFVQEKAFEELETALLKESLLNQSQGSGDGSRRGGNSSSSGNGREGFNKDDSVSSSAIKKKPVSARKPSKH